MTVSRKGEWFNLQRLSYTIATDKSPATLSDKLANGTFGKPPVARFLKAQRAARRNITGQYPFMRPCHRCATVAGKTATFFNENFTAHSLERLFDHGALLRAFPLVVPNGEKS
jgi:hypothetical protein